MSRSRISLLAAISWLPLLALGSFAQAQDPTYNVASDWGTTYPTTASIASTTSATWGAGSVWSAGEMSFNVRQVAGTNSNNITSYYTANTVGYLNSGVGNTTATYTYTVPFQTYQLNPGQTIQQQVGPAAGQPAQRCLSEHPRLCAHSARPLYGQLDRWQRHDNQRCPSGDHSDRENQHDNLVVRLHDHRF